MRSRLFAVLAMAFVATMVAPALARAGTTGLISGNGPIGGLDSQVQASLDGTSWAPAYVVTPNVYAYPIAGTQFVAQGGNLPGGGGGLPFSGSDASPAVDYYRIAFTLPVGYSAASISGRMEADNAAVAYLNGVQIGSQPIADTGDNWAYPGTPFSSSNASLFHAGVNYLSFDLYNMGGPQGLDFQASVTFAPDTTPPAASPSATPAANANGWNRSDVTVAWNWSDAGSGVDPSRCTTSSTSSGEGSGLTLTATCADRAGNVGTATYHVNVDETAPVDHPAVSQPANGAGWNNTDVAVNWNWTDGGSGIDSSNCTQSSTSSGEGTITLTSTCADLAGNSTSDSMTVKVDKTAPVVSYSGNAGTYGVDQSVSITCSASDAVSGVASTTCANVSAPAWQLGLGSHTLSATATDNAGNTGSGSTSFTVTVDATSLCGLVQQFATNAGIANSLCVKLNAATAAGARGQAKTKTNILAAFDNEVSAQSGKAFTAAQATLLAQLAEAL